MHNFTFFTEFTLLGLSADPSIQALLFVLFLGIYLLTLVGNTAMILTIKADSRLRTPMYFFLRHLSFLDLGFFSVTVPKMLQNFLSQEKSISARGCITQSFFFLLYGCAEASLLSAMAYEHQAAVCHPLLYRQVMRKQLCVRLVWGSWVVAFLDALINILLALDLDFCEVQTIRHYSCELPSLLPLSCSDVSTNAAMLLSSVLLHAIGTCLLIFFSYTRIVSTILSISSTTGRSKAFSTCSSHLTAVILFYGSAILRYLMPTSGSPLELILSIQYSVIIPLVNPLIYSLRNKEVKAALRRTILKYLQSLRQHGRDRP